MTQKIALVLYYQRTNKYSINALAGAIETEPKLKSMDVHFISDNFLHNLEEINKKYDKVFVGISFFTTQIWETNDLIKEIRNKFGKDLYLIAGGPHPTGDPKGCLDMGFDVVVIGEGEETLIELLLNHIDTKPIDSTKGIAYYRNNQDYNYTGKRSPINLDNYPPFPMENLIYGAIEITRGCPYACYFCQTSHILGSSPRHRSIDSICKAVEKLIKNGKNDIRFITPNAFSYGSKDGKTLDLQKLRDLLQAIKHIVAPEGRLFLGSFPSEVRPEHVTEKTISIVKEYASNDNIIVGAQSGSQRMLDICHRGHTVEDIYKAVDLIRNANLKANVDFIFGLPKENEEDINQTIKVMKELAKKGARVHTHTFIPLPQTPFAKEPAGEISGELRKALEDLNSKGIAYGEWKKQEHLAKKISDYLKNRIIE